MEARTPPHERLKEWRLKRDLTQAALAEMIGCGHAQICKIERRLQNPGRAIAVGIERLTSRSGTPIRVAEWP